jgi:hypothetical protein
VRVAVVASITLLTAVVGAQPKADPTVEATRLFEEGRALADKKDYTAACDRFTRSYSLVAALGTQLNLGECHEKLGHLAEAWRQFDLAASDAEHGASAARAKYARQRADALLPRLTTVNIRVAHFDLSGLQLRVNGRVVPIAAEVHEMVDPGDVAVAATAPNSPGFARSTRGLAGATVEVDVPALDAPATTTTTTTAPPPPPPPHVDTTPPLGERDRGRVHLSWGLAGGAAATAITSVAFLVVGKNDYNKTANGSHCSHDDTGLYCDSIGKTDIQHAQRLADVSTGFAIGTGALAAAAVIVYFTAPRAVVVAPVSANGGVGVTLSTRF